MRGDKATIEFDFEQKEKFSPIYRKPLTQLTCFLPGGGCVYFLANNGNVCPFCAFPGLTREVVKGPGCGGNEFKPWTLPPEDYINMYLNILKHSPDADRLAIFNGGSFFPKTELPPKFQNFVYDDIARRTHVRQLMVECYPKFITKNKLVQAKRRLSGKDFMVAIGFESVSDQVRNMMLKKGIDRDIFENKVSLLKEQDVQVFVYAFLKAPGLTEKQSLEETLRTLDYLHSLGVDEIALSCAFVQAGTDLETQYHQGEFRPPWLWSIIKIIEISEDRGWPLSVGGFNDKPTPIAIPSNCPKCDKQAHRYIDHYRTYGTLNGSQRPDCTCRNEWQRELREQQPRRVI